MTPSLLVLLLSLGDAPPPTEVTLLTLGGEFVSAHLCKGAPAVAGEFCLEKARVVFHLKMNSLTHEVEVFDADTGAKLQTITVIGGVGVSGDKLYFNAAWKLQSLSLKSPADKPKVLGPIDCGTEASPYAFAVANDQPLCARDPEYSDGTSVNLDIESGKPNVKGTCAVRPADFKSGEMGYTLVTEHLSGACLRLLNIKLKKKN